MGKKKKVGRTSKYETHVKPYLEDIKKYISAGATEKEIIDWLGIASSTFYEHKIKYPELRESLDRPKAKSVIEVKNALYKKATGFTYTEKKQYLTKDKETGKETLRVETTEKYCPPDSGAIAMFLRNNDPEYRDRDKQYYDFTEIELELKKQAQELNNF